MSERMEKLHAIMEAEVTSYINIGRQQERERIIALLESLKGTCSGDCDDCRPYAQINNSYLTEVIALIKGETE